MRIDKALSVVKTMAERRERRGRPRAAQRLSPANFTYQPAAPTRPWLWETATPRERANWIRANRNVGIMDWDLCDLFGLSREDLAAIVKGSDWKPEHMAADGQGALK